METENTATRRNRPRRRSRTEDRRDKTRRWPDSDIKGPGDQTLGVVISGSQTSVSSSHGTSGQKRPPKSKTAATCTQKGTWKGTCQPCKTASFPPQADLLAGARKSP